MAVPTHSSQVLVDEGNRAFVVQWISRYRRDRPPKCLLLLGPCGCGKSTLAELCLAENLYTVLRVDALEYTGKRGLERQLQATERNPLRQAFLVEDPQRMAPDGGLLALTKFVKQAGRTPVVVICETTKKTSIVQLTSSSEVVVFQKLPAARLSKHFHIGRELCAEGDLRQLSQAGGGRLPRSVPDRHMELYEAATRLLAGVEVGNHRSRGDDQTLINMTQANYTQLAGNIHTCAAVASDLSEADVLWAAGDGDLAQEAVAVLGAVRPGQRVARTPRELRPDTVWTKMATMKTREKMLREAMPAFRVVGNEVGLDSIGLLQARWLEDVKHGRWSCIRAWAPEATVQQLTGIMRLHLGHDKSEALISKMRRALKA